MTIQQFHQYCLDNYIDNDELASLFKDNKCDAGQVIFYLEGYWDDTDILNFINEHGFIYSDEIYSDTVSDFHHRLNT